MSIFVYRFRNYLCYIDESETSDIPGNTSHFVLAGLSIPIWHWRNCDREVEVIKKKYALSGSEIHVAWILRPYLEQTRIPNFVSLDYKQRRSQVESFRKAEILRLQRAKNPGLYKQTRKNYQKTEAYIHLTYDERRNLIREIAQCIANWGFARLFAECADKVHFDPLRAPQTLDEQSFEQIVSRFEQYLQIMSRNTPDIQCLGLLVHDNNETVAKRHTERHVSNFLENELTLCFGWKDGRMEEWGRDSSILPFFHPSPSPKCKLFSETCPPPNRGDLAPPTPQPLYP